MVHVDIIAMDIVILAAGQFPRKDYPLYLLKNAGMLVCCDSALGAALRHGLKPDVVIGDFDSVSPRDLSRFDGKVVKVDDQECNDLTKAFRYVMDEVVGASSADIQILGATGKSEAHTLGNMSLLMQYEKDYGLSERGARLEMVSDWSSSFALTDSAEIHIGEGRRVSFFSPDPGLNLRSEGLRWPLDGVVFDNWWKASLNIASADIVRLNFNHPSMLLVVLD